MTMCHLKTTMGILVGARFLAFLSGQTGILTLDDNIISPEIIVVDGFVEVPKGYIICVKPNWTEIERYMLNMLVFKYFHHFWLKKSFR